MTLHPMCLCPYKKRQRGTQGEPLGMTEAEMGVLSLQANNAKDGGQQQKLREGQGTRSPLEPSGGAWSCQHFDFRLLVSRSVRE